MKTSRIAVPLLLASVAVTHAFKSAGNHVSGGIKCHLEKVKDDASQLVAFTYFVPQGWNAHNMFQWTTPGAYTANLSAVTPDKHYSVSQLQRMVTSFGVMTNPQGQVISSKGIPIHHATDFLHAMAEQMKRQYNLDSVEVTDEINGPLPVDKVSAFAKQGSSDPMTDRLPLNEAGFLQIKFEMDGVPMIGSFGTSVSGAITEKHLPNRPDQRVAESGVFAVGPTTVVVLPESSDPKKVKELQLIASSMSPTPEFISYWRALNTRLAETTIKANIAGQKDADLHWHERSMARFRDEMGQKDALSRQFCNYIQDQQDYKDPSGSIVTLPTAYKHAWADGQGNYLLTDDPTTDPRGYGSGKWEELAKYRPAN